MFFKNAIAYRLIKDAGLTYEELEEKLGALSFKPCGSQDISSAGFVPPVGDLIIHGIGQCIVICLKSQEKIIPNSVINEIVLERVDAIEENERRKLSRKERQGIKDVTLMEMLPKAFTSSRHQYAYIDLAKGLLVVNAASFRRAEQLIDCLREALGSFPVIPLSPKQIPIQAMTNWLLSQQNPEGFEFLGACNLSNIGEQGNTVSCKEHDVLSQEVNLMLQNGMAVTQLKLSYSDSIEFSVNEKLQIKQIKFTDIIQERAADENTEDATEQFDVEFSIMSLEFRKFFDALLLAFGGENTDYIDNPDKLLKEKVVKSEIQEELSL